MNIILFRHWWALALRGVLAMLFGLVALFWPRLTLETLVICFGAFALLGGLFAIVLVTALILLYLIATWALVTGVLELVVATWMHRAMGNAWMLLLSGFASLLFGVLLAVLPGVGLLALTWLIGLCALLFGALLVSLGFQWRGLERRVVRT